MNFFDRLGNLVTGARAQWIGPIRFGRKSALGPTMTAITGRRECFTCRGPLHQNGGVVIFCSRVCRHARHNPDRFRRERLKPWAAKPAR